MFRIALCDDDPVFLSVFKPILDCAFVTLQQPFSITVFHSGRELIAVVEKQGMIFDAIFLDVEMPAVDGFQTADRLRRLNDRFILVFTTVLESQAREGYKYEAFRYISKSNLQAEANEAVSAIVKRFMMLSGGDEPVQFKYRNGGVLDTIAVIKSEILYLRIEKNRRVTLKTTYSEYELLTKPMRFYEELLQDDSFCSVLRYYLINFNRVSDVTRDAFIMDNGETVALGLTRESQKVSKEKYMKFLERRLLL